MTALFSDAFCLTGSRDAAADLVAAAYVRAFADYEQFRRRHLLAHLRTRSVLPWLYRNLHAAFCDGILECAASQATPPGGRP